MSVAQINHILHHTVERGLAEQAGAPKQPFAPAGQAGVVTVEHSVELPTPVEAPAAQAPETPQAPEVQPPAEGK
jgi:hypothetical protein